MAAGDYECVLFWTGGAGQGFAYNVVHLKGDPGQADQTHADQVAGEFIAAFTGPSNWNQVISDQVTFQHIALKELTTPPSAQFIGFVAEQGTAAGNLLPPEVSLVTSLHTAHAGKRGRGRIYNWGWSEAANDATGAVEGSFQVIVNNGWIDLATGLAGTGDWELAVYSRLDDETYPVSSITTNNQWDAQRRRRR